MSTVEKLTQSRDLLKQNFSERVGQLDELVVQKHHRTKVSKFFDEGNDLHHQIADKTAKLLESEEEATCNEATATSSEVNNFCSEIFERTQKYLREPTPKSSKRSSKCSSMRAQIELKMQEEELERQAESQKKLLEAELHLKLLQVDEEKRKKVQAAKDKVWLSELDKNSEGGSVDLENDENVQNLTEEWVNSVNKNQDGLAGNVDETTAQTKPSSRHCCSASN